MQPFQSNFTRWRYALKPAGWPKIVVPASAGYALGALNAESFDARTLPLGIAWTVSNVIFVVCLNDVADVPVDTLKRSLFPETSPKTIPDGILPKAALVAAGMTALGTMVLTGIVAALWLGRTHMAWASLASAAFFLAYSFPPARLNYRGGGELLEALGVGAFTPGVLHYLASGHVADPSLLWFVCGYVPLSLSSAVASGLADESSDARAKKHTLVVRLGNGPAKALVLTLIGLGCAAWITAAICGESLWVVTPAVLNASLPLLRLPSLGKRATTDAFLWIRRYKHVLHQGMWRAALLWPLFSWLSSRYVLLG